MLALALAMALLGAPRAEDVRSQVLLLPPATEAGVSAERARLLSQALERAVAAEPGFRLAPASDDLVEALASDPGCRDQPACMKALLTGEVVLVVDPRLAPQGAGLALELRLLQQGNLAQRHGTSTSGAALARSAQRELEALLAGLGPELWLYQQALAGDSDAADKLEAQFPHSPWLLALQDAARRQPPPRSSSQRPGVAVATTATEPEPEPELPAPAPLVAPPPPALTTASAPTAAPEPEPEPEPTASTPTAAPPPSRSFVASTAAAPASDRAGVSPTPAPEPIPVPQPASEGLETWQVPKAMRSGTDDARFRALELAESRTGLTDAIVWVMKNDPNDEVRRKAWRVIRARWRKGVGSSSLNQAAAVWVFEHRPAERAEAAWAIAQYGVVSFDGRDMLAMFDAALKQPHTPGAYDLAAATLILGGRTHRLPQARLIVEEAIDRERDSLRRRQLKRALMQHGGG